MERLLVNLENLPEEGGHFSGELDAALFSLPKGDAQPTGSLSYDLDVQKFEGELFVSGKISAPFLFECVRTLQSFVKTISKDDFSVSLEIEDKNVIDISNEIREEILLNFPSYPKCDMADEPLPCEINSSYLEMDKCPQERLNTSRTDGNPGVWEALDSLQQNPNDSHQP